MLGVGDVISPSMSFFLLQRIEIQKEIFTSMFQGVINAESGIFLNVY